jgi:hypothetical protein
VEAAVQVCRRYLVAKDWIEVGVREEPSNSACLRVDSEGCVAFACADVLSAVCGLLWAWVFRCVGCRGSRRAVSRVVSQRV